VLVLIDAEPLDLRLQGLPWNAEFRGSSGRSGCPPMALSEGGFDHLQLTVRQHRERFIWAWRICRFAPQPALTHYKAIAFTQDNGAFDDFPISRMFLPTALA
jgi:hypothetical protein